MLNVLLFVAGLVALITGASLLVRGASGWQPLGVCHRWLLVTVPWTVRSEVNADWPVRNSGCEHPVGDLLWERSPDRDLR